MLFLAYSLSVVYRVEKRFVFQTYIQESETDYSWKFNDDMFRDLTYAFTYYYLKFGFEKEKLPRSMVAYKKLLNNMSDPTDILLNANVPGYEVDDRGFWNEIALSSSSADSEFSKFAYFLATFSVNTADAERFFKKLKIAKNFTNARLLDENMLCFETYGSFKREYDKRHPLINPKTGKLSMKGGKRKRKMLKVEELKALPEVSSGESSTPAEHTEVDDDDTFQCHEAPVYVANLAKTAEYREIYVVLGTFLFV